MQLLKTLNKGDLFRCAYPNQVSLNNRPMPKTEVYKVIKIYAQSPGYFVSISRDIPGGGIYTLHPNTPILLPHEFSIDEDEVLDFLEYQAIYKPAIKGVYFRLLWDGKSSTCGLGNIQKAMVQLIFASGKLTFTPDAEFDRIVLKNYHKFSNYIPVRKPSHMFSLVLPALIRRGFIEKLRSPLTSKEMREANIEPNILPGSADCNATEKMEDRG